MSTTVRAPRRLALIALLAILATSAAIGVRPADARPAGGDPRIVGGTQAAPKAWPSTVAILDNRKPGTPSQAYRCVGTVVNRSWVLTSALCVTFVDKTIAPASVFDVLAGTQRLDQGGQRIKVAEIRVLPGYKPDTFDRSVAMLRLATPTTAPVQPLTLQGAGVPVGSSLISVGWGTTTYGQEMVAPDLRQASLTQLSNAVCAQGFGTQFIPATHTCVSGAGQDTCDGDGGAPLLVRRGAQWVVVGLAKAGDGCGQYPAFYQRLESFANWIRQQINPNTTSVTAKLSATKVPVRASVTVSGVVKPAKASPAVALQRKVGTRWIDVGTGKVDATTGAYRIGLRPSSAGIYTFRVRTAGTKAVSSTFYLKVG